MINENININSYSFETYLNQSQDLVKRHDLCKPPREAYLFFPNNKEQVEFDPKNPHKTLRRIFQNKLETYIDYEEKMLKELEEEIQHYNIKYPEDELIFPWWYEKFDKLRFLQASGYKIQKTIKLISQNIGWRNKLIPPVVTPKIFKILNCGFVYIHGRDYLYRPIIVISFDYYKKYEKKYQYNDWLQAIIFIMEYLITHMTIPGQVENWNIITDIGSVSLLLIPTDVKSILNVLQANYRCRLFVNFIFGMSFIMRGIVGMFKAMLDETAQRKIRFIKSNKLDEVFEIINEEQVEQRFGGKAPNVVPGSNRLFPPIVPSANYETNKPKELISEAEYKEAYVKNKLSVVNEYYHEKWKKEEEEEKTKQSLSEEVEKVKNYSHMNREQILKEKIVEHVGNVGAITNNFPIDHLSLFRKEIVMNEFTMITEGKGKEINLVSKLNKNRTNFKFANKVSLTPNIISSLNTKKIVINKRPSSLEAYDRISITDERPTNYLEVKKLELGLKTGKNKYSESIERGNLSDNKSENLYDSKSQIQIYTEKNCNVY